jgi:glucose/arabinose dehydrogenase
MLSRIAKLGVATVAAATGVAVFALDAPPQAAPDVPAARPAAAMSPFDVEARGADVGFTEYEAESADHTGTVIGPDLTQASLPSEASGRQAVQLTGAGQYVEFTLTAPANAVDVRYSVQDGREGTLSVYVNGTKLAQPLPVTAKYSHIDTPWIPGAKTHHFYDNDRLFLGADLAAGDTVRLQVDGGDTAAPYTIDLADFEQVAPAASQPQGSVSVIDHGATPDDGTDDTSAFAQTIAAAKQAGAEVWIPKGVFTLNSAQQIDGVTIRGAGNWYSVIRSNNPFNNGGAQGNIKLYDFAIIGAVTERNDGAPDNGFHGVLGANSVVSGLWIENTKCGLWLMNGASSNLRIENNRIQNVMADGINFDGAVTDSVITNNFFRNTGDDAIATWSNGAPNRNNSITNNTVVQPNLANGIAIYGGEGATVSGNVVADTNALGGGITVANRFNATPLTGTFTLADNTTIRAGALDPNWQFGVGALWFDARDSAITNARISVTGFEAIDSPYEAFQFIDGNGAGKPIQNVTIDGATVDGVGTFVAQSQTQGSVTISNVTATDVGVTGTYNCSYPTGTPPMTFGGSGNSGWDGVWEDCSTWPDPARAKEIRPAALQQVELAKGVAEMGEPMSMAVLPDTSVLHTSRDGTVRHTDPAGTTKVAARIPVYTHDEEGLQGITADPDFARNRWVYMYYSPPLNTPGGDAPMDGSAPDFERFNGHNVLSRFTVNADNTLDLGSEVHMLEVATNRGQCCHVGGDLDWDAAGNLYLSTGDDTNPFVSDGYTPIDERASRNPVVDAQRSSANTNDLRGKLLRITPQDDGSYTVPAGNLFAPGTAGTRPEIYAMGFRNPFRFTVDEQTGIVWLGDYGPDAGGASSTRGPAGQVEFDRITGPGNFGWPYCTGDNTTDESYVDYNFENGQSGARFDCANPVNDSPRNTGQRTLPPAQAAWIDYDGNSVPEFGDGSESPMGGVVYHYDPDLDSAAKLPQEYDGHVILGEFGRRWLKDVVVDGNGGVGSISPFPWTGTQVMDLEFGPDGALYVLDYGTGFGSGDANSALYRIQAAGAGGGGPDPEPEPAATVTLNTPTAGSVFEWGDAIPFDVTLSDPAVDCQSVTVTFILGHDSHGHPLTSANGCQGVLQTSADNGHDANANVFGVIDARYTGADGVPVFSQAIIQPLTRQGEHFGNTSGVEKVASPAAHGANAAGAIENGDWISYTPYDLAGVTGFAVRASSAGAGGTVELRAGAADGPVIGSVEVGPTGDWESYVDVTGAVAEWPADATELFVVFTGGDGQLLQLDEFTLERS